MFRSFTKAHALAALAALPCALGTPSAGAAETFDYVIVTTAPGATGKPQIVDLKNGDLLRSGARFRVELVAHAAGRLEVVFQSAQGETMVLASDIALTQGDRLNLPDEGEWYFLDDLEGVEKLEIRLKHETGGEWVEHVIRHVSPELFQAGATLPESAGAITQIPASEGLEAPPGDDTGLRIAESLATLPPSLARYRSALEQVGAEATPATRGAKEAKLFRELSPGVVMVVSEQGIGSGAIISEEGLIVTNWHVVQGSESLGIVFKPRLGEEVKPSDVYTGLIERINPELDLALVRVVNPPEGMTVLALGEMADIEVGSDVHAIGHPKGEGWTYTKGFISQVRPNYQWPNSFGFAHKAMVIQTQTPISPGSSGSPLISDDYRVIGLNSFKKEGESLNFAVSVTDIRKFLSEAEDQPATLVTLAPEADDCEPRSIRQDTDDDGKADRIKVDTNCDGKVNLVIVDEDQDGLPDFAIADRDGNGKPDLKLVSTAKDGRFDLWLIDSDGDGSLDMVGYDQDLDGIVDRYTRG